MVIKNENGVQTSKVVGVAAVLDEPLGQPVQAARSGVCTHPQYQRRGLARRLMLKLICRQCARAEAPFLHVMSKNAAAHRCTSA